MNKVDAEYFRIVNEILTNGKLKKNRTGVDTISIFGAQAKYNVDLNAFPILTTKKVHWPAIVHELLWFISGNTNIKYLVDNNVRIWNEWAFFKYKKTCANVTEPDYDVHIEDLDKNCVREMTQDEFINEIKTNETFAAKWGELGEGTYGGMWRAFPFYTMEDEFVGSSTVTGQGSECWVFGQVDQLQKVIEKLKTNPDDRRMIISAWHPYWADHCALPPCHCFLIFNTEELTYDERFQLYLDNGGDLIAEPESTMIGLFDASNVPTRRLNLMMTIRSNDIFLGKTFNITSYALMVAMMAHVSNMVTGTLTYSIGDAHLYTNHLDQIKLQMSREPMKLPRLWLNPEIKSLFDFKYEDIKLIDYQSHPTIKADVAV
jgi:thymidylate synthase